VNVLVVHVHPVPDSFIAAVRDRAVAALSAAGHDVELCDLYAEGFDPRLSRAERLAHHDAPDTKPAIAPHATRLRHADALVFVYPTWWGGLPAMLKGWIDRVWIEGVAYTLPSGSNRVRGNLRNISRFAVITTHGSPKWINVLEGEPGKHQLRRCVRVLCRPVMRSRWIACYGVDRSTPADRARFLDRVERAMRRL
jgi:NAD(P)H dehydrogenase (quinone)